MVGKKMGLVVFSLVLIAVLFIYLNFKRVNYELTEYEERLIRYFNEVALQSEYNDNPQRIIKWRKPMILYVHKDGVYKSQMQMIHQTINDINGLATDGFKIVLSEDISECNAFLYLCNKEKVAELNPDFYQSFEDGIVDDDFSGLAYVEFNWSNYNINKVLIYIDSEDPIDVQKSTILEEITQSIGLPNDPKTYSNSIFYEDKSEEDVIINRFSEMDSDIVRLLYHPKMKPGLNFKQVEKVIKRILKEESEKGYK